MAINPTTPGPTSHGIVVKGLSKHYGKTQALKGINFTIQPGEIVGFLGPNGAGKTTTMKILTCLLDATAGQVSVAGFDVQANPTDVRKHIGYLPENIALYDEMILLDYLNFVAEIRDVPRQDRKKRIQSVAHQTGLSNVLARVISELSKGYRQRIGLAQAIIHEPDVLILDEPTTGLDPNQLREIRDVIKNIGREKTVIFSTHILQEVTAVCDRIIIIAQGQVVADGTLEELSTRVPTDNNTPAGLDEIFRYFTTQPDQPATKPPEPVKTPDNQEKPGEGTEINKETEKDEVTHA